MLRSIFFAFRRPSLAVFVFLLLGPNSISAQSVSATEDIGLLIDAKTELVWKEYDLRASQQATDGEWIRRVFLDVIGRVPSYEEVVTYLSDHSPQKQEAVVDRLLFGSEYADEFARHWTGYWANLLVGRTGGFENNSLTNRDGLERYLRESFRRNKPYNEFVRELLTATGTNSPGSEAFNGAVNFLTMKLDENATLATARTAQLFLGRQIQCTQCHNHPFTDWTQSQFWEFNSFFRQTVALRKFEQGTREVRTVELTDQDFRGEGSSPEEAEVYYEQRNGILKAVYPKFVDGTDLPNRSGYLEDVNRRLALSEFVVASPSLAESFVNRLWGYFFGHGFTSAVDDMGPHNPPSHPELLDALARAFERESYDIRALMRWIVLSRPYSLSSRTNKSNAGDDPSLGESPKFSRFYLRQMTPEQLYESMLVLTEGKRSTANIQTVTESKRRWLRQFARALGNDEGGESSSFDGTIPQTLMMFNGGLIRRATGLGKSTMVMSVANSDTRFREKVNAIYIACFARKPTGKELKLAKQLAIARRQDAGNGKSKETSGGNLQELEVKATAESLRDLLWVLTNSNEFVLNH